MDSYLAPTSSDAMRQYVLSLYAEAISRAATLREWMLLPAGNRKGPFQSRFRPFFHAFVELYQATRGVDVMTSLVDECNRIDTWILKCQDIEAKSMRVQDNRCEIGLKLFNLWSKALAQQGVVEFK